MTTALIQPLSRGFHEITSGQWTWQEMASSFNTADWIKKNFHLQQSTNATASLISTGMGLLILHSRLMKALDPSLTMKYRLVIELGLLAWLGAIAPSTSKTLKSLSPYLAKLKNSTPQIMLVSQVGITIIRLFKEPKEALLELTWMANVFFIPNDRSRLDWRFHHFVFIPLTSIAIYHSSGSARVAYIHKLFTRTLGYYPVARQYVYQQIIPQPLHQVAGLLGV